MAGAVELGEGASCERSLLKSRHLWPHDAPCPSAQSPQAWFPLPFAKAAESAGSILDPNNLTRVRNSKY